MAKLRFSFRPVTGSPPENQYNHLGNIADDVWKGMLQLERGMIVDGRYIGVMQIAVGRMLRKKERDHLEDRMQDLRKSNPELDARIIYEE